MRKKPPKRPFPYDPLFKRVRRDLIFFPVPDGWYPSSEEKYLLEELDALTPEEIRALARFAPALAPGDLEVVPPDELP